MKTWFQDHYLGPPLHSPHLSPWYEIMNGTKSLLLTTFKALNNVAPPYLSDILPLNAPTRCLRYAEKKKKKTQDHQERGQQGLLSCCTSPLEHPPIIQAHTSSNVPSTAETYTPTMDHMTHFFLRVFVCFPVSLSLNICKASLVWVLRKALYKINLLLLRWCTFCWFPVHVGIQ